MHSSVSWTGTFAASFTLLAAFFRPWTRSTLTVRTLGMSCFAAANQLSIMSVITMDSAPAARAKECDEPDQARARDEGGVGEAQPRALDARECDCRRLAQRGLLEQDRVEQAVQPRDRAQVPAQEHLVKWRGAEEHHVVACYRIDTRWETGLSWVYSGEGRDKGLCGGVGRCAAEVVDECNGQTPMYGIRHTQSSYTSELLESQTLCANPCL